MIHTYDKDHGQRWKIAFPDYNHETMDRILESPAPWPIREANNLTGSEPI